MNKKFALSAAFLALFVICSTDFTLAQPKAPLDDKKEQPPIEEISPEKTAEQIAGMLKRDLNLTDEQYKQIYDIALNYHSTHDAANFDRDELNAEIESVLTAEQREKFEKIKKEQERINKNTEERKDTPPMEDHPQGKPPRGKPPGN